ncbi:MAG: c-type cytochrome [Thermoanaerobaculia bacterium]|nr:c-type cytochrome [Thermoanaerobaculia bacterium]
MRQLTLIASTAVLLLTIAGLGSANEAREHGTSIEEGTNLEARAREIFDRKNCAHCHSIEVEGIEATTDSEKMRGPELSALGERMTAPEIEEYLSEGDPTLRTHHWKEFWGSEDDLEILIRWLATLEEEISQGRGADDEPEDSGNESG